ncbi:MAG TPA: hypothetical protein VN726_17200 [Hanamia sp.]|nr:hypothetical protein [Hanamia sp.]
MKNKDYTIIKRLLAFFIISLLISGLTAIPVNSELSYLLSFLSPGSKIYYWLHEVSVAYSNVSREYPFLFYGYDWLAFAHFILAILFIGPWQDPVRNIWVIKFGLIACVLIFPFAFIAGHFRGIPFGWQLIDCSFGLFGIIPLWICYRIITRSSLKK